MTTPRRTIPNAVPHLAGNEWKYVKECLDTNWVSSAGPFVDRFEREIAQHVGVPHAVATVNGTAAIHVALLAAGVRPGDEVLVPAFTFVATANAVAYCGAHPVFLDSEEISWGLDPARLAEFLEREGAVEGGHVVNRRTGRVVRALLPVHLYGHPCDLDPLLALARRYPMAVVEDSAEALGARYRGRAVGVDGLAGCLSFNGNKIITTGAGGMVLTRDEATAARVRRLTTQARGDDMLTVIVGDDRGSRLFWEMVDPGFAEAAELGYNEFDGSGAYMCFFSCPPEETGANLERVRAIYDDINRNGVTEVELAQAKSKVASRIVLRSERPLGRLSSLGHNWLQRQEYRRVDDDLETLRSLTLADIRRLLDAYPLQQLTTSAVGPLESL